MSDQEQREQQFLQKWCEWLAGIALYGTMRLFPGDGPMLAQSKVTQIPSKIEELVKRMFADAQPAAKPDLKIAPTSKAR